MSLYPSHEYQGTDDTWRRISKPELGKTEKIEFQLRLHDFDFTEEIPVPIILYRCYVLFHLKF